MRLIRCSEYIEMPWRNGAGLTHEIARDPPAPEPFHWRLSLATVSQSGPFSRFCGYRRSVILVNGGGFRLDFEHSQSLLLNAIGHSAHFSGDIATTCSLLDGPSRDLSLMVRVPGDITAVTAVHCDLNEQTVEAPPGAMQAWFCLEGAAVLTHRHEVRELAQHDTAISHCSDVWRVRARRQTPTVLLSLIWNNY